MVRDIIKLVGTLVLVTMLLTGFALMTVFDFLLTAWRRLWLGKEYKV